MSRYIAVMPSRMARGTAAQARTGASLARVVSMERPGGGRAERTRRARAGSSARCPRRAACGRLPGRTHRRGAAPSGEMEPCSAPESARGPIGWRWLAVLAVPALYLAATAWTTHELRPLWMGGSTDPTYPYVLNSLLVAEGRAPEQATHPGTPL